MSRGPELVRSIYEHLVDASDANKQRAMEFAFVLVEDGPDTPGAPQAICDAAFHGESLGDVTASITLYELLPLLPACPPDLAGQAMFRSAQCHESRGNWGKAMETYPKAYGLLENRDIKCLAGFRLALLMISAEEYESATDLLQAIALAPANVLVDSAEVAFQLAFCLSRCGQWARSRTVLSELAEAETTGSPLFIRVHNLLAEICQATDDLKGAAKHLHLILVAPGGDPHVKALASQRIDDLRLKKRSRR